MLSARLLVSIVTNFKPENKFGAHTNQTVHSIWGYDMYHDTGTMIQYITMYCDTVSNAIIVNVFFLNPILGQLSGVSYVVSFC